MTDPATIHAMCEDYRASASIDLKCDEADAGKKITVPAARAVGREGRHGAAVRRAGDLEEARHEGDRPRLPGGHNLQEDVPDMVLDGDQALLKTVGDLARLSARLAARLDLRCRGLGAVHAAVRARLLRGALAASTGRAGAAGRRRLPAPAAVADVPDAPGRRRGEGRHAARSAR